MPADVRSSNRSPLPSSGTRINNTASHLPDGAMFAPGLLSPEPSAGQSPGAYLDRAPQACRQCSRLKRKCQRELPFCSLCARLGKTCQYPTRRKTYGSRTSDEDQSTSSAVLVGSAPSSNNAASPFPDAFFIDVELFRSVAHSTLRSAYPVPAQVSQLLGLDSNAVCEPYFNSVDKWFPFISKKGLNLSIQANLPAETPGLALLLLCMKLASDPPQPYHTSAVESTLYRTAKSYLNTIEEVSPASLHVFQALVLIALYEYGHGIFPAAYLTVGRAARLGVLRGIHDRKNSTQLFVGPPTWTYNEEERRTWWATCINLGPTGLPLATPEPARGNLLPTIDEEWSRGEIGPNQALFMTGFSPESTIGPFARVCQTSHILGRVINHKNYRKDSQNWEFILDEALQLNTTLSALDSYVSQPMEARQENETVATVDVALCISARLALYHMYACNEPDVLAPRRAEETQMQAECIVGIKQIIATRSPALARCVIQQGAENLDRSSPLVIQSLYDAATECQWFLREGDVVEGAGTTLRLLMGALNLLAQRWGLAGKYNPDVDFSESDDH
ncbi:hypothetical protein G7Z17_g9349 [Cylindrodendrum hubeiense]|uniref:Zn(2)-C6 fungal-type domain-containing protein n=1 Tax=Cylindrodendrum hubeiense TaxID=595255 RepID=A0A9P5H9D1_9HYPO|nr:hypothetical protein G7Z17_g9349 [Cylindrodendrum hubeiense]